MKESATPMLAAVALAVCCGVPALLASGALAAVAGAVARWWPAVVAGTALLLYAAARIYRRAKAIRAKVERIETRSR